MCNKFETLFSVSFPFLCARILKWYFKVNENEEHQKMKRKIVAMATFFLRLTFGKKLPVWRSYFYKKKARYGILKKHCITKWNFLQCASQTQISCVKIQESSLSLLWREDNYWTYLVASIQTDSTCFFLKCFWENGLFVCLLDMFVCLLGRLVI